MTAIRFCLRSAVIGCVFVAANCSATAQPLPMEPLRAFIDEMVGQHGFDETRLEALFKQVSRSQAVLDAIARPAEAKPWYQYRKIFLTEERTSQGNEFWMQHADVLAAASARFGVPAEIIVAILGVESLYGRYRGKYRVIEALSTLAFEHPARGAFFRRELSEWLLLAREQTIDPLRPKGSYAGAVGMPQFIPSSYRAYAVDFDADRRADLWSSVADVVGSVANYLAEHGWQRNQPIVTPCTISGLEHTLLLDSGLKPNIRLQRAEQMGIRASERLDGDVEVALIMLQLRGGKECWLGLNNFYTITRYNHSELYAMAVYQLAQAIRARYAELTE